MRDKTLKLLILIYLLFIPSIAFAVTEISNAGTKLGIGTTSVSNALTVKGGVSIGTYTTNVAPSNGLIISGNVGVGTTVPQSALTVNGTITMPAGVGLLSATSTVGLDANGDSTPELKILTGGNVGIGSTNPEYKLVVNGNSKADTFVTTTAAAPQVQFIPSSASDTRYTIGTNGDGGNDNDDEYQFVEGLALGTNVRIAVAKDGNVGIGTTGALAKLHVNGQVKADSIKFLDDSVQTTALTVSPGFQDVGTVVALLTSSDNVGLGTTASSNKLTAVGTIRATEFDTDFSNTPHTTFSPTQASDTNFSNGVNADGQNDNDDHYRVVKGTDITSGPSVVLDIDTNGNVGVGTSAATGRMDIRGDEVRVWTGTGTDSNALASGELYVEGDLEVDGTVYMGSCSGAGCGAGSSGWTDLGTNIYLTTLTDNVGVGTSAPTGRLSTLGNGTGTGINFQVRDLANTARVTILDNGNIGVGSTVPSQALDIGSGKIIADGSLLTNLPNSSVGWTDGGTNVYVSTLTDNVGVGTSAPTGKLSTLGNGTTTGINFQIKDLANTARVTVLDNGNVGIGSTVPDQALVTSSFKLTTSPTNGFILTTDGNGVGTWQAAGAVSNGWTDGGTNIYLAANGDNVAIGTTNFSSGKVTISGNGTTTGINTQFQTSAGTAKVTIQDSGNIGIGSTVPSNPLDIIGGGTSTGIALDVRDSSALRTFSVSDNGNVGIGTTSISSSFTVRGAGTTTSYNTFIENSSGGALLVVQDSGNVGIGTTGNAIRLTVQANSTGTGLSTVWQNSSRTRLIWFLDNGNVGIGSSNPAGKLGVGGSAAIGSSYGNLAAPTDGLIVQGNVGIGSTVPAYKLDVTGTAGFTGLSASGVGDTYVCLSTANELRTGATCAASTEKVKENVKNLTHGLDWVMQLRPITFKFKEGYYGGIPSIGFLAEEVAKITPLLVTTNERDGIYSVRYDLMTAVLTLAVQELNTKVIQLEKEVKNLKEKGK